MPSNNSCTLWFNDVDVSMNLQSKTTAHARPSNKENIVFYYLSKYTTLYILEEKCKPSICTFLVLWPYVLKCFKFSFIFLWAQLDLHHLCVLGHLTFIYVQLNIINIMNICKYYKHALPLYLTKYFDNAIKYLLTICVRMWQTTTVVRGGDTWSFIYWGK